MDCSGVKRVDRVCYTVVSDTLYITFATLQNPAVYLLDVRVSILPTLVPRLTVIDFRDRDLTTIKSDIQLGLSLRPR